MVLSMFITNVPVSQAAEETSEKLSLNKPFVESGHEGSRSAANALDDTVNTYYAGPNHNSWFYVDLEEPCYIDSVNVYCYRGGTRYYQYEVYGTLDGSEWELIAEKKDTVAEPTNGISYDAGGKLYRFVKLQFRYNSSNSAVHCRDFSVYGRKAGLGESETDPADANNIAYGKETFATTNNKLSTNVTDGILLTQWESIDFPAHVDVDLGSYYNVDDVQVFVGDASAFTYAIYGSNDGVNFDRLAVQKEAEVGDKDGTTFVLEGSPKYRIIRVNVTRNAAGQRTNAIVREIKIHGTKVEEEVAPIRTTLDIDSYETWLKENHGVDVSALKDENGHYDIKDTYTNEDTYNEINGIVTRILGEEYVNWFSYEIKANEKADGYKDYFTIEMKDGKVHISGDCGVSITSGLNHYLKEYCNVHVSQETTQVNMPENIVEVSEKVYKDTPFEVRYAYNYCTLSYTMSFWGYDEWQREMDWLALSGANVILDLTGMEGMFIHYLQKLGYSIEEAKSYVSAPTYRAWWLMGNLEGTGGPVSDQWVYDSVELARVNQRKMTVLGMQPVLEGFMGTLPTDIAEHANPIMVEKGYAEMDASLVEQGEWSHYQRPILLRTDYAGHEYLAEEFYASQEYIYGQTTKYYAGDLAHEGGVIPSDLSKPEMAQVILSEMMDYDEDATWIIQSWSSNPSKELIEGFGENREDHVLILDLNATANERWSNETKWGGPEFNGTSWLYCMIENYGGRPGMHGELQTIADRILEARNTTEHCKGIGLTSEGTENNPVNYEMLWYTVWNDEPVNMDEWLKDYITRRYGAYSENVYQGWLKLEETIYGHNHVLDGTGDVNGELNWHVPENSITSLHPSFSPNTGLCTTKIDYDATVLEEAVDLIMKDFDTFKNEETFIYDIVDLQRQLITNTSYEYFNRILESYSSRDLVTFNKYAAKYLSCIEKLDEIASYNEHQLTGRWIALATDFYNDERTGEYDDFAKDMMEYDARALISTWASRSWFTYCHRQYSGILMDFAYRMWDAWLTNLRSDLEGGEYKTLTSGKDYFNMGWDFVLNEKAYPTQANEDVDGLKDTYAYIVENYDIEDARAEADSTDNIAPEGSTYAYSTSGSYVSDNVNDGSYSSYWWSNGKAVPTYVGVDLGSSQPVYGVKLVFETRYPLGNDILPFTVESMTSNTEVKETLATGQNYDEETNAYMYTMFFDELKDIQNLRVYFSENNTAMYPAIAEVLIYSCRGIYPKASSVMATLDTKLYNMPMDTTVSDIISQFQIAKHNTLQCLDKDGNVLSNESASADIAKVQLVSPTNVVLYEVTPENTTVLVDELRDKVAQAQSLKAEDYAANGYNALQEELTIAQAILEKESVDVNEVSNEITALENAMKALIDLSVVKAVIAEIDGADASLYKASYFEKYETLLEAAKTAIADPAINQTNADKALDSARLAKKHLVSKYDINLSSLGTAYSDTPLNSAFKTIYINDGVFDKIWVANTTTPPVQGGIAFDEAVTTSGISVFLEDLNYRGLELGFKLEIKEAGSEEYVEVLTGKSTYNDGAQFYVPFEEPKSIVDARVTITSYSKKNGTPYPGIAEIIVHGVGCDTTSIKEQLMSYKESNYTKASWTTFTSDVAEVKAEILALTNETATVEKCETLEAQLEEIAQGLVEGNPDEKVEGTIRIGSQNLWAPNPSHPDVDAFLAMFERFELDFIGLQEVDKLNGRDSRDVLAEFVGESYPYHYYKKSITYKDGEYGIGQLASKEPIEVTNGTFEAKDGSEYRSWQRMLVEFNGKQVAIYNTHMGLNDTANASHVAEMISIMDADPCKYVVLTGDFNATTTQMDPFKEDYVLANGQDGNWYNTYDAIGGDDFYGDGYAHAENTNGIDNIIVSKNIELVTVRNAYSNELSDHMMFYADVKLLDYDEQLQTYVNEHTYTQAEVLPSTWDVYATALENAQALLAEEKVYQKQDECKMALETLTAAVEALIFAPTKVSEVVAEEVDYKTIQLTWKEDVNASYYVVERKDTTTNEWMEVGQTNETTYTHAGVKTGKTYTYRVKSVLQVEDTLYEGEYSEETSIATTLKGELTLTLNMKGSSQFELSWNKVEGATRYVVYRKSTNSEYKKIVTLGKDATTYTTKMMAADTYNYVVKAARYDSKDRVYGSTSNEVEGIVLNETAPTLTLSETGANAFTLSWNKVNNTNGYELYQSTNGKAYRLVKRTKALSFTPTIIKTGTTYTYKVRGYVQVNNTKVYTPYSEEVTYVGQ